MNLQEELEALKRAESYAVDALRGERRKIYSNILGVLGILNDLISQGEHTLKETSENKESEEPKSKQYGTREYWYSLFATTRKEKKEDEQYEYIISDESLRKIFDFTIAKQGEINEKYYNFVLYNGRQIEPIIGGCYNTADLLKAITIKLEKREKEYA